VDLDGVGWSRANLVLGTQCRVPILPYVEQSKCLVFGKCAEYDALAFNKQFVVQAVDVFVSAGRDKAATFSISA
jgi:hypothetical protein